MPSAHLTGVEPDATQASRRWAWYNLAVLTLVLMQGMIDRFVLSLLVEPVKHDLTISDGEMSLLLGASFALFYSFAGVPAGYLVDRFNRKRLLLAGGLIWTSMTTASAFAPSFGWLMFFRSGVGIGEAVLSPAIYSIIRDGFEPKYRGLAFSINNMGSPLGTGLALVLVGHLTGFVAAGWFSGLPAIGELTAWRLVLALTGLCGLPIILLVLTVKEPARHDDECELQRSSLSSIWKHFRQNQSAYLFIFLSTGFYGTSLNGLLAWLPTAFVRAWSLPIAVIGPRIGGIQLIAAPLGLLVAGLCVYMLSRRDKARWIPFLGALALLAAASMFGVLAMAEEPRQAWIALQVLLFLTPWSGVCVATLLARITPGRMMGKIAAINFLMLGLVGMIAGPSLNPFLAETYFTGIKAMIMGICLGSGSAMALSALILALAGFACWRTEEYA